MKPLAYTLVSLLITTQLQDPPPLTIDNVIATETAHFNELRKEVNKLRNDIKELRNEINITFFPDQPFLCYKDSIVRVWTKSAQECSGGTVTGEFALMELLSSNNMAGKVYPLYVRWQLHDPPK